MAKKIYVVIVDDDLDNQYLTNNDFEHIDWIEEIKIMDDARSLFSYLDAISLQSYPSLIIVDYMLSRVNGEELYHLLKANTTFKNIQVAFYSSNLNRHVRKRLEDLGVQYFERPITALQGEALAQEIKEVALKNALLDED